MTSNGTYLFGEATCSSAVISHAVSMTQFLSLSKHLCATKVNASITSGAVFGRVERNISVMLVCNDEERGFHKHYYILLQFSKRDYRAACK